MKFNIFLYLYKTNMFKNIKMQFKSASKGLIRLFELVSSRSVGQTALQKGVWFGPRLLTVNRLAEHPVAQQQHRAFNYSQQGFPNPSSFNTTTAI